MNYFAYWWTKLRLRAAGCAVRWAKNRCSWISRTAGGQPCCWKTHISGLSGFPLSGKNSRCASSACRDNRMGARLSWVYVFDAGEITLSGTAEDIPLYDQKIALVRHQNGDWGGVTEQEWAENNRSLQKRPRGCPFPVSFRELPIIPS